MPESETIVLPQQFGLNIDSILQSLLHLVGGSITDTDSIYAFFVVIWWIFSITSYIASAVLLYVIIYTKIRLHELEHTQEHAIEHAEEHFAHEHSHGSKNHRWQDALAHTDSDNPNDWRLAIIEADIMLEDLLSTMGYSGSTIGDKLKQASPQFFKSVDDAWKAHKVRNEIAHKGSDFILTKRVAKETMDHYRRVFEEFHII